MIVNFENLVKKLPFKLIAPRFIQRGNLVACKYLFWKHDNNPLLLITDSGPRYIRGINLHYLTKNYFEKLIKTHCGNKMLTYSFIKNDKYIVSAFRTYKINGIQNVRLLDCNAIKSSFNFSKPFNPQELNSIKEQIREKINQSANSPAENIIGTEIQ